MATRILSVVIGLLATGAAWADVTTTPAALNTQPQSHVMAYGLMVMVLVLVLLGGAFLIINLGLLSKRKQDRVGVRAPSELGFFQDNSWLDQAKREEMANQAPLEDPARARNPGLRLVTEETEKEAERRTSERKLGSTPRDRRDVG